VLVQGALRRSSTGPDYRTQLDFNHLSATPLPLTDVNLTLGEGEYVSGRCFDDHPRSWQLRTRLRYVNPDGAQIVDSTQQCGVR
jgi:hypothetical protein